MGLKRGIILVLYILNFNFKFSNFVLFWVFLLFCGFSCLILLRQSDFKCLVAYSSVLHINFCFIRLLGFYISYNFIGSRQVLQFCSFNFNKIFQLILVLVYIFNLRFPLLGGFMSELLILILVLIL